MKYRIAWSINEQKLYLVDVEEEFNVIEVSFGDYKKYSKEQKIEMLKNMVDSIPPKQERSV